MDMYELLNKDSPQNVQLKLAQKFKQCRKQKHISQKKLAELSLVSYGAIKLFEQTGKISLTSLILICEPLGLMSDFNLIFNSDNHRSYEDIVNGNFRHK